MHFFLGPRLASIFPPCLAFEISHITTKNHHQKTVHFEPESPVQFKPELGVQFAPEYPLSLPKRRRPELAEGSVGFQFFEQLSKEVWNS